jgi:sugar lactone lactonase YvrE
VDRFTGNSVVTRCLRLFVLVGICVAGIVSIIGSGSNEETADSPWAVDKTFSLEQDEDMEFDVELFLDSTGSYIVNDLGVKPSVVTTTNPGRGAVEIDGSQITYTPDAGFLGVDSFDYTITDANGNSDSGEITVAVTVLMPSPRQVAVDGTNNRALVTDDALKALIEVDLATGVRTILSDMTTPDASNPFSAPNGVAIDIDSNRALVTDLFLDAVIAVDLADGARTVISDAVTPDAQNAFISPDAIAIDAAGNRALVVDSGLDAVIAVDLTPGPTFGARTILSDQAVPDDENVFSAPTGIAIDSANSRALVTDRDLAAVIAVDLTPGVTLGARTILSDVTTPDAINIFLEPDGIVVDAANNRALVVARQQTAVLSVDLTTGVRSIVSSSFFPNNSNVFVQPGALAFDAASNRAIVVDTARARIIAVALVTDAETRSGERTPLPDTEKLLTDNQLLTPHGITIDAANDRALVTDSALDAVVAVDAETGERTILSDTETPDADNPFDGPIGLIIEEPGVRGLVVDQILDAVMTVDLVTGARTILSNATTPDEQNPFSTPVYIALDFDDIRNRVLVTDLGLGAVLAVDRTTGARTILSGPEIPDAVNVFNAPDAIVIDETNERALVVDRSLLAVLAVDLVTGERTILSDQDTPDDQNQFVAPSGIFIDTLKNRVLVADQALASIIAVDLDTGARTILSDTLNGAGSALVLPVNVTAGFSSEQFLVLDQALNAVFVVSDMDGDRVIMSR